MDPDNPLLPPPGALNVPPGLHGDDLLDAVFEAAMDHVNLHAIAWPARDAAGELVPPPPEHVLDHLARANDLADEEEALASPGASTVAVVHELPRCDVCGSSSRYDASIDRGGQPYGAFLCPACYAKHGSGSLGASGDVYLMLTSDVPKEVQEICNQIGAAQGKDPMF